MPTVHAYDQDLLNVVVQGLEVHAFLKYQVVLREEETTIMPNETYTVALHDGKGDMVMLSNV